VKACVAARTVVVLILALVRRPIQAHVEHDDQYERRRSRFPDARLSAAEVPFARDRVSVRLRRRKAATSSPSGDRAEASVRTMTLPASYGIKPSVDHEMRT
jgi:hypothetical protein